jgi:hypothetical protein
MYPFETYLKPTVQEQFLLLLLLAVVTSHKSTSLKQHVRKRNVRRSEATQRM